MNLLREYIRELLREDHGRYDEYREGPVESKRGDVIFREVPSPLTKGHMRLQYCDYSESKKTPITSGEEYFDDVEEFEYFTSTGKRLKKPRRTGVTKGVTDPCVVGFLDYSRKYANDDGTADWKLHYVRVRDAFGGRRIASSLFDEWFRRYSKTANSVDFGDMMQPQIVHLLKKIIKKYPGIYVHGRNLAIEDETYGRRIVTP
jgi:hypothetical protein